MIKIKYSQNIIAIFALILTFGLSSTAFGAATIVIVNVNGAGVGFNDTTTVTPVGGNPGTTLGQQRLNAFQEAANIWGATLTSTQTITISAQFSMLTCTATSAVLGSAGAATASRNFAGAAFTNTNYSSALANKISGTDLNGATADINANFNVNLGNTGCLDGSPFYYGFDGNEGAGIDLVAVLLHEFGHGFGFQTFTNGTSGAQMNGFPTIYDRFLLDDTTGKSWLNMTNAERVASAINPRKLVWDGPQVQTDLPSALALGTPLLRINSPAGLSGSYDVGTASFGPALTSAGITGNIVVGIDPNDSAGTSTTDGCSPLTNAPAVAGNIVLLDRGTCGFVIKAANAQNAGAIALIVADNAAGGPPAGLGGTDATIIIPAVRVTLATGNSIKAQLASTPVNGTLTVDNTIRAGADTFGKALMYTPNPFQSGSSVSHWDTSASPNLLMEPAINADLTHVVTTPTDLTFSQLRDIGWTSRTLPNTITTTGGNNQSTGINQPFAAPLQVTVNPIVQGLTVTFTVNSTGAASGTFANSGSRPLPDGADAVAVTTNSLAATAVTDASGTAVAPTFTANGTAGNYTVNATVPGAGTTTIPLGNLGPTAAAVSISGRIVTPDGRGLRNAFVTVTRQNGERLTMTTGAFGYYAFANLVAGETIAVRVESKRYHFQPQVFSLSADLSNLNFTALP